MAAKLLQLKGQPPSAQLLLVQPAGGAALAAGGTTPRGFWSGNVSRGYGVLGGYEVVEGLGRGSVG